MLALLALLPLLALLALSNHAALAADTDITGDAATAAAAVVFFEAPGLGRVRGQRVPLPGGGHGIQVIGLPYANQPVPRFAPASVWNGSYQDWDATGWGPLPPPPCPQMDDGQVVGGEDCLHLNIFLPPLEGAADQWRRTTRRLPVYVFIHGGSYILGSPNSSMINGVDLAAEKGVVVVTLAYRLGALGFLAHPAMDSKPIQVRGVGATDRMCVHI